MRLPAALLGIAAACGGEPARLDVHLGEVVDASGEGEAVVAVDADADVVIHLDGEVRVVEVFVDGEASALLDGVPAAAGWFRPRPVDTETMVLAVTGEAEVTVWARGAPAPAVRREASLVWTDPAIVDDAAIVGPARLLAAAGADGHGGRLLDAWFRRFATTAHSERAAPAQLMDELAALQGADPSTWDLDALPFTVTGVHNRLDLAARDGGCGQLRVSMASTHTVYAPLHLIFLFRQAPAADDVTPGGTVHCLGAARRWARLAALDGAALTAAAAAWLDSVLVPEQFLMAETVELTVSPWEWRQWVPAGADALDNPLLFQTLDLEQINLPGALRDDFLGFVEDNAAGLAARTVELPGRFRGHSARVNPVPPFPTLDLSGLDPAIASAFPELAGELTIVGCPTCHTTDAEFVQTSAQRLFSPFYDRELDARAARLDLMNQGADVPVPPFGPLQD